MPKPGGDVVLMHHASMTADVTAYDVAVDGTSLYWSASDYFVWAMPIDGDMTSAPTQWFAHNSLLPRYITVDDMHVVYASVVYAGNTGDIVSGWRTGSGHPFSGQAGIAGIAFPGAPDTGPRPIIWGHSSGIREGLADDTGKFDGLYTGSSDPVAGVATDGTEMFWISNNQIIKEGSFGSMPKAADTGCISPPQDLGPYADIAVDEQWIYFTWPNKNEIDKCPR